MTELHGVGYVLVESDISITALFVEALNEKTLLLLCHLLLSVRACVPGVGTW